MQTRTFVKDGVTRVEVIDPSDGAVTHTCEVNEGQQCVVTIPAASSPADIEFGDVEAIPAAEGEASEGTGTGSEGEAPAEAEQPPTGEPTTSAQTDNEKPLYRVYADTVPEGLDESGLQTPDGFTLYHYEGDTAGEAATFDVGDGAQVGLYAEADDDEVPVVAVPPVEGQADVSQAEGAETPADGSGGQPA